MKVLHFYKTSLPETIGGVEQVIDQIARGTKKFGVSTEVLSLSSCNTARTTEFNGYRVHLERRDFQIASTGFSISAIFRFVGLLKNADIVHYHFPWPFMDIVHILCNVKKPVVLTYHSDIIRQKYWLMLYRPLKHWFLSKVDHIVATSPNYLATSDVLRKYSHKVSVIPIGLDKSAYPVPDKENLDFWRGQIGPRFFLFVGVLRYYKGLHILLEAAKLVEYPIVIVGAGPTESELKSLAQKLKLTNVIFLGQLPELDKVALLMTSYAVVFPSHLRSEAFGISLLEGAMYGKPLISSEIGTGTTYINIANETGLVVPPSDPVALSEAMRDLWNNPGKAMEMGSKAEKRYWDRFTAMRMAQDYAEVYRHLLERY